MTDILVKPEELDNIESISTKDNDGNVGFSSSFRFNSTDGANSWSFSGIANKAQCVDTQSMFGKLLPSNTLDDELDYEFEDEEKELFGVEDTIEGEGSEKEVDDEEHEDVNESNNKEEVSEQSETEVDEVDFEIVEKVEDETTFVDLGLSRPLLKAIGQMGWVTPFEIQKNTIPILLKGRDVCGSSQTGTGKTGAFLLPMLERLLDFRAGRNIRGLIILPSRELAQQVQVMCAKLCQFTNIKSAVLVGGVNENKQRAALKEDPEIIIATPGRLLYFLLNDSTFHMDDLEMLVLDECDKLLEHGFKHELEEIFQHLPPKQRLQSVLFTATFTSGVDEISRLSLHKPARVEIDPLISTSQKLSQEFVKLKNDEFHHREALCFSILKEILIEQKKKNESFPKIIVFFNTKSSCHRFHLLAQELSLPTLEIHGNLTQLQRFTALETFSGQGGILLSTNVISRGLDIRNVDLVMNYHLPNAIVDYIHRIGRTARANASGRTISFIHPKNDKTMFKLIIKTLHKTHGKNFSTLEVKDEVYNYYEDRILSLGDRIKDVLREERYLRELQAAERDIAYGENMLKYAEEIYKRGPRKFTVSEKDREDDRARDKSEKSTSNLKVQKILAEKRKRTADKVKMAKMTSKNRKKAEYLKSLSKKEKEKIHKSIKASKRQTKRKGGTSKTAAKTNTKKKRKPRKRL
ncbi:hypothetical protein PCE1_004968 [Barthelona sp. PCE]